MRENHLNILGEKLSKHENFQGQNIHKNDPRMKFLRIKYPKEEIAQ